VIAGVIEERTPVRGGIILEAIMRRPIRLHPAESRDFDLVAYEVTLDENGAEISRTPADLTGAVITFTVRSAVGSATALITKVSTDAAQIQVLSQVDAATRGRAILKLLAADTVARGVGSYVYDIWIRWASPARTVVLVETSPFLIADRVTLLL
jgi:hypothetical protein